MTQIVLKKIIKNIKNIKNTAKIKSERHVFTEEINKFVSSPNDDKRIQSIDSIETCAYGTSKDLVNEKEKIQCNHLIKQCKND